jgi:hypothetical protein
MVVGIAAALMAAGCASEVVEAPAVEPAAGEAPMAEAVMEPDTPEAPMAEAAMEPDTPEAPMAEAAMEPDTPVTEEFLNFGVGTVRTYDYTINGEDAYEIAVTVAEKQQYKRRTMNMTVLSNPIRDPGGPCDGANNLLEDATTGSYAACLKDGKILSAVSPHDGRFEWPLQVGNTWRSRSQYIDNVLHPDWSGLIWQGFEVLAWEEVAVPAGTFMAYKVGRTYGSWDTAKEEEYVIWYAPEPQMIIKVISTLSPESGYGGSEQVWELVSYDVK